MRACVRACVCVCACVKFWLNVLTSSLYEGRLPKKIARQAAECGNGVWIESMAKCMGDFES